MKRLLGISWSSVGAIVERVVSRKIDPDRLEDLRRIGIDRFHVQRLATDAVDAVRREQLRELRGTDAGRDLFRMRFALWKNPWNLTAAAKERLSDLPRTNAPLYRAYLLKEGLAHALDYRQPWRAKRALKDWLSWASRSRLKPFVKAARTIRKHFDGVLAYVADRMTNAVVEASTHACE